MYDTPPSPSSPGPSPQVNRPDAATFFREYYHAPIPTGRFDPEVRAFEAEHGSDTGFTRDELVAIAKKVRAEVRVERAGPTAVGARPDKEPDLPSSLSDLRGWLGLLRGITYGRYLLATIALIVIGFVISRGNSAFQDLTYPLVVMLLIAGLLVVSSTAQRGLEQTSPAIKRLAGGLWVVALVAFTVLVGIALVWTAVIALRSVGLMRPLDRESVGCLIQPPPSPPGKELGYSRGMRLNRIGDGKPLASRVLEDPEQALTLGGFYVEFDPGETKIDVDLYVPHMLIPRIVRLRMNRDTRTSELLTQ